jgi:hypothetical protein
MIWLFYFFGICCFKVDFINLELLRSDFAIFKFGDYFNNVDFISYDHDDNCILLNV